MDEQEKDEEEEKEPETELEDEPDEILVDTNSRAIDLKKIKEKYPDFAKTTEFRELRNAYHRESQYTELFPTLEDAKEAAENNNTFNKLNDSLIQRGDSSELLTAIKDASPQSFKRIANGFLDTVARMDNNTYVEIITPVVKKLARQIYDAGQKQLKRNDKSEDGLALVATARNIMQYAFEDADAINKDDEPRIDPQIQQKEQEISRREIAIRQERFNGAYNVVNNSAEKNLDKAILQGLDPDNKMNEFTRDTLVEKIKNEVKKQIDKDTTHVRRMTSLWKRAEASGYSRENLSSIVSAYLERARPIIPVVRNKYRSIANKGRVREEPAEEESGPRIVNRGRSGRAPANDGKVNIKRVDPKKIDYRNTSDDDIFDGKVKLKQG
jgi:hypothetical protein